MAESNPRFSSAQRQALHAQPLTHEQLAAITGATILPADRTETDGTVFTPDDTRLFTSGFLVDDVAPGTATEGDLTTARVTPNRVTRVATGNDAGTPVTYGAGVVAATTPRTTLASDDPAVASLSVLDDWDESDRAKVNLIAGQAGVTGGAGVVAANTPRITLASDDPAVAQLLLIAASLSVLDDWDETNRAAVNTIAGQVAVTGGAGVVAANTQRVTLASDDPAVVALQVIDDWDESDRAKVNPIVGQAGVTAGAGVVAANTPRVTLASDDPAVVSLSVLDDWDETNRAAVNTIAGQVGVQGSAGVTTALTQRVVLAAGSITLQASQVSAIINGTTTRMTTAGVEAYRDLAILINITAGGAATGTLQIFLQDSWDGGTTWDDLVASNTFAFGAAIITQRFVISGRLVTTLTQGSAVSNGVLAAGTVRNGPWGDRIRVQEVVSGIAGGPTGVTYVISCVAK